MFAGNRNNGPKLLCVLYNAAYLTKFGQNLYPARCKILYYDNYMRVFHLYCCYYLAQTDTRTFNVIIIAGTGYII